MVDRLLLDRLAGRQRGLLTTENLLVAGMTSRQINHAVRTRRLIPVRHGVYRVSGAPVDLEQTLLAAALGARADAVISHASAAAAWGVKGAPPPDGIHLLVAKPVAPRMDGVIGHTTTALPPGHRGRVGAVPVTSPARTVIDICGQLPGVQLAEAIDDLRRRNLLTLSALAMTFAEVPAPGRRKSIPVSQYLHQPDVRPGGSVRELDVLRAIRAAGLPVPEQQWKVHLSNGRWAYLDFAYPEILEALEFMGFDPHGRFVSRFHADAARTRWVQQAGWRIWPITAWTTGEELLELVTDIAGRLEAHRRTRSA